MGKEGKGKLLHTVAITEEIRGIGQDAKKTSQRNCQGGSGEEPHHLQRIEQEEIAADNLDEVNAHETAPRKHGCPLMEEEEHRALVVEDVDIKLLACEHGIAYCHIDIGIVPRIERVKERAGAEQGDEKHSKEEQKKLFHWTSGIEVCTFLRQSYENILKYEL